MKIPRKLKKDLKLKLKRHVWDYSDKLTAYSNIITVKTCLGLTYAKALQWLIAEYPSNRIYQKLIPNK